MIKGSQALEAKTVEAWEHAVDVVVVGLGIAGTCAALEAHRAGANVLVIERQPDSSAYLIVDSEIFAYPEQGTHKLIDGFETVQEMETALGVPQGALAATVERYNVDAAAGEDSEQHKRPEWLKPLDKPPYAAFDLSFNSSVYAYIALGGLKTNVDAQVLDTAGEPVAGLYAAGACAAHLPMTGAEYASGLSLGPGSYFGRRAGGHAAAAAQTSD
ncbi:MAG: FAD-dependent oxidoreductase [Pseudomonadales bacterium]